MLPQRRDGGITLGELCAEFEESGITLGQLSLETDETLFQFSNALLTDLLVTHIHAVLTSPLIPIALSDGWCEILKL